MHRIVVDAMGGERAPDAIVEGAAEASLHVSDVELILVGDASMISRVLPRTRHDGARVRIHHATSGIDPQESAVKAIVAKPDASIVLAAELVARGEGDALVSAGPSGAIVLACRQSWQLVSGAHRPAQAAVYPTELRRGDRNDPFALLLDVGASHDATAEDLVNFAVMGATYARLVSRNRRPRVALLATGQGATRGSPEVIAAHAVLRETSGLNFIGNIEAVDIPRGVADVIVTSGFLGNVVLTMLEGVPDTMLRLARYAYKQRLTWRLGLFALSSAIERLKVITDWEEYGGAPLLGFRHPMIKAHPRSDARGITKAIKLAKRSLDGKLSDMIAHQIGELDPPARSSGDEADRSGPAPKLPTDER